MGRPPAAQPLWLWECKLMKKDQEKGLAWTTPELRRIHAGSAENLNNTSLTEDGGAPSQDKS